MEFMKKDGCGNDDSDHLVVESAMIINDDFCQLVPWWILVNICRILVETMFTVATWWMREGKRAYSVLCRSSFSTFGCQSSSSCSSLRQPWSSESSLSSLSSWSSSWSFWTSSSYSSSPCDQSCKRSYLLPHIWWKYFFKQQIIITITIHDHHL